MGKRVKSCGKVFSSLYIEYIIKEYKGKQRKGKKGGGKECSTFVYRYSIQIKKKKGKRKGGDKGMFIIYRYIER